MHSTFPQNPSTYARNACVMAAKQSFELKSARNSFLKKKQSKLHSSRMAFFFCNRLPDQASRCLAYMGPFAKAAYLYGKVLLFILNFVFVVVGGGSECPVIDMYVQYIRNTCLPSLRHVPRQIKLNIFVCGVCVFSRVDVHTCALFSLKGQGKDTGIKLSIRGFP